MQQVVRRSGPFRGAIVAGAFSGFIAAGVGSRVVMRIIAFTNDDRDGVTTDGSAVVGEITLGGTFSLLALGTLAGVLGGLVYLGLRRWLFVPTAWRGVAFAGLTLLTIGQPLFDPANVDFQIFEPVILVIAMFAVLFFINGLILAPLLQRIHPEPSYPVSTRVPRIAAGVLAIAGVAGTLVMAGTVQTMIDDEGRCFSAAGRGQGCAVLAADVAQ